MARYVDVEGKTFPTPHRKILNDFIDGWNTCLNSVLQQPTADVVEVRHGRWIHTGYAMHWHGKDECSECTYHTFGRDDLSHFNFCPQCGAKMDKGEEENDGNN